MHPETRFRAPFGLAYPPLCRYARHRGLTGPDAEDLVAQTLEVAWRRLDDVPAAEPLPWLYAVADNLWRNQARRDGRRRELFARFRAAPPAAAGVRTTVLDAFERDSGDIVYSARTIQLATGSTQTQRAWTYPAFPVPGEKVRFRLFSLHDGVPVEDTESVYVDDTPRAASPSPPTRVPAPPRSSTSNTVPGPGPGSRARRSCWRAASARR